MAFEFKTKYLVACMAAAVLPSVASAQATTLWSITTTDSVYIDFSGSISGDLATGSASTLNWMSAGYNWSGTIGLTDSSGRILAVISTNADDTYTLSTKGGPSALIGQTCSGNATACLTVVPGTTQSLYSTVDSVNGGQGIFAGGDISLFSAADIYGLLGPMVSAADTQASMERNIAALRNIFNLLGAYLNPGLSYDCDVFGPNGLCASFSGRYSQTSESGPEASSGVLTIAYKASEGFRIGGFIEQFSRKIKAGNVELANNNPDVGIYAVWTPTLEEDGLSFRLAYRYGNRRAEITRDAVGTAEAGEGNADLVSQGLQATMSRGYTLSESVKAKPYVGVRYTNIQRDAYTESSDGGVTSPLSYKALRHEAVTLLLGVDFATQVNEHLSANGGLGIESDLSQEISAYSASGLSGLNDADFDGETRKHRGVISGGLRYTVSPQSRVDLKVVYRGEAYDTASTTTGLLTYSAGF